MLYVNPIAEKITPKAGISEDPAARTQALGELEHLFLFTLLQEMNKTTTIASEPQSSAMETYNEMLNDALSGEIARSGQFGIAKCMEQQMTATDAALKLRGAAPVPINGSTIQRSV